MSLSSDYPIVNTVPSHISKDLRYITSVPNQAFKVIEDFPRVSRFPKRDPSAWFFFQLSAKCKRTLKRKLYINTNLARVFKMFSLSFSHTQTVVWAIRPKPFILNRSIRSRHSISLSFSLSTVKALLVCSIWDRFMICFFCSPRGRRPFLSSSSTILQQWFF